MDTETKPEFSCPRPRCTWEGRRGDMVFVRDGEEPQGEPAYISCCPECGREITDG